MIPTSTLDACQKISATLRNLSVTSMTPGIVQTSSRRWNTSLFVCPERRTRNPTTAIGIRPARRTMKSEANSTAAR